MDSQINALASAKLYDPQKDREDLADMSAKLARATLGVYFRRMASDKETSPDDRQAYLETARRMLDDNIVDLLAKQALVQIEHLGEADEVDRRAEDLFKKYAPNRATSAEKPPESPEKLAAELRRSLSREIIIGLAEWSRDKGFEDVVARIVGMVEALLTEKKVSDCAKINDWWKNRRFRQTVQCPFFNSNFCGITKNGDFVLI